MTALFYCAAAVAVAGSALAVTRTHAIHALLYLVVALFAVALVFLSLGAPFLAALEIIVYAGAIMVLFLFVVMMLNLGRATVEQERRWLPARAWIVPLSLSAALLAVSFRVLSRGPADGGAGTIGPEAVGTSLFTDYLVGVELASVLLLAGLVGAYYLGRRDDGMERAAPGDTPGPTSGAAPEPTSERGAGASPGAGPGPASRRGSEGGPGASSGSASRHGSEGSPEGGRA